MPTKSTKIPAVREAIASALEGDESLSGIKIANGAMPERKKNFVWVQRAKSKRIFRLIGGGPTPQEEEITIVLYIWAVKSKSFSAAENRALEIFEAVETVLREDVTLNDLVFQHNIENLEIEGAVADQVHGCRVVATVNAKARI